jgi:membrane fusion protein (multidrug efflux system)
VDDRTEQSDLLAAQASVRLAEAAMEVARAGIQVAQADLDFAKATQRRYQDASVSRSVSDTEVDRAKSAYDRATADLQRQQASLVQAEAERDQARARVQQIETILAKKQLVAPFRARASMRTVHPGQYLAEGTSIVELTELTDQIYLDFAVPQEYSTRVEPGAIVIAQSRLLGSDQAQIKVESMDATVNPVTRWTTPARAGRCVTNPRPWRRRWV